LMVAVNTLSGLGCHQQVILQDLVILLAPFAPHMAEELWQLLGHTTTIAKAPFPVYAQAYVEASTFECPIAINGKVRTKQSWPCTITKEDLEKAVLHDSVVKKWLKGQIPKKIIYVPCKMLNIVI